MEKFGETYSESIDKRASETLDEQASETSDEQARETLDEQKARLTVEKIKFEDALSRVPDSNREFFKRQAMSNYIIGEDIERGLEGVPYLSMSGERLAEYATVRHEALMIFYANNFSQSFEEFSDEIAQDIACKNTLDELKLPQINRKSRNFSRFGSENRDEMVKAFCGSHEDRIIKLDNILGTRDKPRGIESPTTDLEYHTMLRLVSREWEQWKKDNNIIGDGTDWT